MYTLRFVDNSLQLLLNDDNFTDQLILNQKFKPGNGTEEKREWDSAQEALNYWNESLSSQYPQTVDNITIEVL